MKNLPLITILLLFMVIGGCTPASEGLPHDHYFPLPEDPGELISSEDQDFYVQTVLEGISIPWGVAFLPDGSVLITERSGTIHLARDGQLLEQTIGGVPDVFVGGTSGLLDIKLHPDYENNGWIYITYSADIDGGSNTALMRARLDGMDLTDQDVLFVGHPLTDNRSHSGSRIVFRDGYVYFSIGDRGVPESSQDLTTHSGSILRLYEDGSVPQDNPFAGREDAQPEIYSYGHRNPQGLAFHPETGQLWANEHGPKGGDELNHIEKGVNYGWPEIAASGLANDDSTITRYTVKAGMRPSVHHWTPTLAPSSLIFVTGKRYPGWKHDMMIGGLRGLRVNRLVLNDEQQQVVHEEHLLYREGRMRNVSIAPDGFMYIANESTGQILRLIPAAMYE